MIVKKKIPKLTDFSIKIYLFGSALYSEQYNDIDLLIVYDQGIIGIETILSLRHQLKKNYYKLFKTTLDICLLSKKEDKNNPFRKEENAKLLFG
jgi:predicted nucleotidyltransferase